MEVINSRDRKLVYPLFMGRNQPTYHPGRLTWNLKMMSLVQIIFLFQLVPQTLR